MLPAWTAENSCAVATKQLNIGGKERMLIFVYKISCTSKILLEGK